LLLNLTNFFILPGIRTQTDHLLGVIVLVDFFFKPEAENIRNVTDKTT